MYFGVPPVVHNLPPLPEVAGSAGLVIDKRAVAETAAAILNLWQDENAYQQHVLAARQRATAFTDQALATALRQMMQEIVRYE
jgi:glycosyltransferase involved in cell wall biosynthesis